MEAFGEAQRETWKSFILPLICPVFLERNTLLAERSLEC